MYIILVCSSYAILFLPLCPFYFILHISLLLSLLNLSQGRPCKLPTLASRWAFFIHVSLYKLYLSHADFELFRLINRKKRYLSYSGQNRISSRDLSINILPFYRYKTTYWWTYYSYSPWPWDGHVGRHMHYYR